MDSPPRMAQQHHALVRHHHRSGERWLPLSLEHADLVGDCSPQPAR
jgi:hypothetical protein